MSKNQRLFCIGFFLTNLSKAVVQPHSESKLELNFKKFDLRDAMIFFLRFYLTWNSRLSFVRLI